MLGEAVTMKALVTGATGLIGRHLICHLQNPVVLSRDPDLARATLDGVRAHAWTPEAGPPPASAFDGVDVVFHLAGEPVAGGRWTAERKRRIRESRLLGTHNLVAALTGLASRPQLLVSASAVGYYGDRGDEVLDETASPGQGFLAELSAEWEREALAAEQLGLRVVCLRTGIVLSREGGALPKMLPAFRAGVGGKLGTGRQWMPWIHLDDEIGLLLHAMNEPQMRGAVNAVGPHPVTNQEFTRVLARILRRPAIFPVPEFALRVAFGQMSQLMTASQRVNPTQAKQSAYHFRYPELEGALRAELLAS